MLKAYATKDGALRLLPPGELAAAVWLDLVDPRESEVAAAAAMGFDVPSLEDMGSIEVSNRLYHIGDADYLTIVLPGQQGQRHYQEMPVCIALRGGMMMTVRHHRPRPFETFPERAQNSAYGCDTHVQAFFGLIEEIIGRLAGHLEEAGAALEAVSARLYIPGRNRASVVNLKDVLIELGHLGKRISGVRLSLLTMERALSYAQYIRPRQLDMPEAEKAIAGLMRDVDALEEHTDYLSQRLGLVTDGAMSAIHLEQNITVRIVSVVAMLFSPPTLIASVYGMNFAHMPELSQPWGYAASLGAMAVSALLSWAFFRWRGWL